MRVIRSPENSNISQCFSRNVCMCVCVCGNSSVVSDSLGPQWTVAPRLLCPWNSLSENTGVGCYALLQGIFPTQGSNPGLLHYRQILYHLSHRGSHKECIRISTSIHQKQRPHFFLIILNLLLIVISFLNDHSFLMTFYSVIISEPVNH